MFSPLLPLLALAGAATAALDFSKWKTRQPGEFRAPCPAMNSLANHNFIQRDGRNITVAKLVPVLEEVFNLSPELATIISNLGLFTAPDPSKGVFTLDDLNRHNLFEHDASLSREDFYYHGDASTFRPEVFKKFFDHFKGMKYIDIESAAAARYAMVLDSRKRNPTFTYGVQQRITSYGETNKYLRTMAEPATGKCLASFVKILFEQERLPFNEGWRPPTTQISGFSMASDVLEIALVTPEKLNDEDKNCNGKKCPKARGIHGYFGIESGV
ncbi:Peroxidase, family 2-domain-containing protein [Staphylotrichum tortipilum]|uniref:Peroxidase, family 2-domain-containing protein n=1 Tax=Staphylotrichum tortipilum TaxID=2831512 RepID=A0AAN6MRZ8_9PEZI|nr:Peroxidase, family 2-domain-containing protein [Staphylotrichum longicolle]